LECNPIVERDCIRVPGKAREFASGDCELAPLLITGSLATHMTEPTFHDQEVHVREFPVPGNARLFHLTMSDGTLLAISTDADTTDRTLSVTPPSVDEALATVHLSNAEATTLSALLSGIRFVIDQPDEHQPVDAANLRTITLPAGSPAIGRRLHDLDVPDHDSARVIAVVRDDTDDLIEADMERPCRAGDRLILVGRPGSMSPLVKYLLG
jgi:TrkA domain protein